MWSPDGRFLAYRSTWSDVCEGRVYLSDPAGHVVASFPGTGWLVSWSPDSTRVATWVGDRIGIYGIDGVRQALLAVPPGCALPGDFDAVWSPDATSLVVWPCEVPVDGRTPQRLPADDPRAHFFWAYSPDGTRVVYGTPGVTGGPLVLAADGSLQRVLVPHGDDPRWSPAGDRIAFVGKGPSGEDELQVVDVASGTVTTLASSGATDHLKPIGFAPEGDRILFARSDADSVGTGLWSVDADGSDPRLLVAGTGWGDWQWQPAGP